MSTRKKTTMANKWVEATKANAKVGGISYMESMQDKDHRVSYHFNQCEVQLCHGPVAQKPRQPAQRAPSKKGGAADVRDLKLRILKELRK